MNRIIFIALIVVLSTSCRKDEDAIDGTAINFYPTVIANAVEEDGQTYVIKLETSGIVEGEATVEIEVTNSQFLLTDPPLTGNIITLDLKDEIAAEIEVQVLNDNIPDDYEALFRIVNVTGAIADIGKSEFSLQVKDDDIFTIFSENFESGLGDFTTFNVDGGNNWGIDGFTGNPSSSSYQSPAPENEDNWLISPEIDFDEYPNETISFLSKTQFNDQGNRLQVFIISGYTSGNPASSANIVTLSPKLDPHTGGGRGNLTSSGDLDVSNISGIARVAFRFKAVNAIDASAWEIDNVVVNAFEPNYSSRDKSVGCEGTGAVNTISIPFTDSFESCATVGQYNIPSNWIEKNVPGSKTDRGWGCREFGIDGSWGANASAFGGSVGADNAWLITNGVVDLSGVTTATLVVWVSESFDGPGKLSLKWSSDFNVDCNPENATWTEVGDFAGQLPASGAGLTEITSDLSAAAGQQVYIAFQYSEGTSAESVSFTIDDLSITGN